MNQYLKTIQDLLQQNKQLSEQEKDAVIKAIADAEKQWSITDFKLDRTEKVKKTTAILLEETIAELEQKRKAVEAQNRELEIESALERVRSVAMGMKKAEDMLDVCKTISQQLELLHIKEIRNIQTAIFYEATSIYINYEFYRKHDKLLITEVDYDNHPVAQDFADRMTKGPNHVWTHEFKGEEVRDWLTFQKTTNVFIDSYLEKANSLNYYWFSLGPVALGISTYSPLNEEEINLFKRFRNVFELAYRRYIDIEKAEAQAREAQIEAALERVRSRSMGMQKSDELREVVAVLYEQMEPLGLAKYGCELILCNEQTDQLEFWHANPIQSVMPECYYVSRSVDPICEQQWKAWKEGTSGLIIELKGEKKHAFDNVLLTKTDFKKLPDNIKKWINAEDIIVLSCATMKFGFLEAIDIEALQEAKLLVLNRFAKVFEQTYTRFLDLQKAEAQAREAQIQLAMERVRARTMAMQKSEELKDAAALLFQQAKSLGVPAYSCGYNIWEKNEKEFTSWMSTQDGSDFNAVSNIPLTEDANFIRFADSRQKGEPFFVLELRGERMQEHYEYLKTIPAFKAYFDYAVGMGFDLPDTQIHHLANFSQGNLLFITLEPCPEFHDVFKRFASVFEQTYTRFLDLQKAEAQARESQIQLALERVRARTMAMQKSEELSETSFVLFQQLKELGEDSDQITIGIFEEDHPVITLYATTHGSQWTHGAKIELNKHSVYPRIYSAWKNNLKLFVIDISGKELEALNKFKLESPDYQIWSADELPKDRWLFYCAYFSNGFVSLGTSIPRSNESIHLLERFAQVFEQTYTRFLDLQKAEAQAREAKIEAALEKVRSRTMAMQRSEELSNVATVLFQQVKSLGVPQWTCGFCIWDIGDTESIWYPGSPDGEIIAPMRFPLTEHPVFRIMDESRKRGDELYIYEKEGEVQADHYRYMMTLPGVGELLQGMLDAGLTIPTFQIDHYANFAYGNLIFITYEHFPEMHDIFKRFAKVFEQTYTRFLDLKKAEAQARESQIEVSLERVRSKTMAMHNSQDVGDTVATMFDELVKLGVKTVRCGIGILHEPKQMELWTAKKSETEKAELIIGRLDMTIHPLLQGVYNGWKNKDITFSYDLKGKDLVDYFTVLINAPEYHINYDIASLPQQQFHNAFYFSEGALFAFSPEQLSAEASQIFKRFAGVFGQTYRRYLDLQKAEAQAREAQIEASLERVRTKAMAMHKTDDLKMAVATVFEELDKLNLGLIRCGIAILDKEEPRGDIWITIKSEQGNTIGVSGDEPLDIHPLLKGAYDAWLRHEDYSYVLEKDDLLNYYQAITKTNFQQPISATFDTEQKDLPQYYFNAAFQDGSIFAFLDTPFTDEAKLVMKRFAKVFNLTYKRFLDLQKAESQAREAQIEAALEKVRASAMAMQKSDGLFSVAEILWEQLKKLGQAELESSIVHLYDNDQSTFDAWYAYCPPNHPRGEMVMGFAKVSYSSTEWTREVVSKYQSTETEYTISATGEKLIEWYRELERLAPDTIDYDENGAIVVPDILFYHFSKFSGGALLMISNEEPSPEACDLHKRAAVVFDLAYTRFLDLKKAEAQAREATIEAALEKVRGKAMAMHNSNDLSVTASMVFTELRKLGINPVRCGVSLQTKDTRKNLLYYSIPSPAGDTLSLAGSALLAGHPVLSEIYDSWIRGEDYFPVLKGESLTNYYQTLKQVGFDVPVSPSGHEQYGYYLAFSEGMFYVWVEKSFTESEIKILKRFASVIDLTFRRYFELQKSEANAREAVKQAALDRVRAEIASMRTISDLDRITPLIWNELTILGIRFIRCGVFIMDESQKLIHTFLSTPDGKAIAAFHLPYVTPGPFPDLIDHWRNKKIYVRRWSEDDFLGIANTLVQQGAIATKEQYLGTLPKGGFYLHFLPFLQGLLYVGNIDQLGQEEIILIQHVADAFSTAYARYEDFNKLEAAKQQVDKTLVDLKQAQTQLVQSEKMASLGELTAGIAHEIQNPLNFVNNFSDVSNELLEEMKGELATGNMQQAIAIADDVRQNLEKILHHGKRADAIVKGMLQHSRASSGQKEPTDINALADEYLRLAYHGLRAKEKSFNAKFETDFDQSVGKINIISQEIGRVVLNLINNAFYAVSEKKKIAGEDYEPTVTITTRKHPPTENGGTGLIEISVSDNGIGIPEGTRDKIFQPFFTTKPSGQGTGLGLSLAYDIITKGHGGDIMVKSIPGKGSEFIIHLPAYASL